MKQSNGERQCPMWLRDRLGDKIPRAPPELRWKLSIIGSANGWLHGEDQLQTRPGRIYGNWAGTRMRQETFHETETEREKAKMEFFIEQRKVKCLQCGREFAWSLKWKDKSDEAPVFKKPWSEGGENDYCSTVTIAWKVLSEGVQMAGSERMEEDQ